MIAVALLAGKSHELATFEGGHVGGIEFEPFTVLSLGVEPLVPIGFDARRIVGADFVDQRNGFRELNLELVLPAPYRVTVANLVIAAAL
jgi:hypothetical protein